MRRDEINVQVATTRRSQRNLGLNVLQVTNIRAFGLELELNVAFGWNKFLHSWRSNFASVLNGHSCPTFGHCNHCSRIHEPVTKSVRHISAQRVCSPVFCHKICWLRCAHHNVLHVAPGETRIGLENQSTDAGGKRRTCRCSRVVGRARMVQVGGGDLALLVVAAAVGGGQG